MAKKLSSATRVVTLLERDYLMLLEDHIVLRALKIAGIEKEAVFKAVDSIIRDKRVEVHIRPIEDKYR